MSLSLSTGTGFATCSIKESAADSDADLDVDGDDTLEYGKAQYTEADIIPCSGAGEDQGEAREREALRGAVLKYDVFSKTLAMFSTGFFFIFMGISKYSIRDS